MVKKCITKPQIFSYIKYDGTNAEECTQANKDSLLCMNEKLIHTYLSGVPIVEIITIGSHIVFDGDSKFDIFTEEKFFEIFECVDDLTEQLQLFLESNTPIKIAEE